jgi:hypothetical protein
MIWFFVGCAPLAWPMLSIVDGSQYDQKKKRMKNKVDTGGKRHFAHLRGRSLHLDAGPSLPAEGDEAKRLGNDRQFAIHLHFDDACGLRRGHQRLLGHTRGSYKIYGLAVDSYFYLKAVGKCADIIRVSQQLEE